MTPTVAKTPLPTKFAAAEKHILGLPPLNSLWGRSETRLFEIPQIRNRFNGTHRGAGDQRLSPGTPTLAHNAFANSAQGWGSLLSFWSEAILGWREERFRSCADTRPSGRSGRSRATQIRYPEKAA